MYYFNMETAYYLMLLQKGISQNLSNSSLIYANQNDQKIDLEENKKVNIQQVKIEPLESSSEIIHRKEEQILPKSSKIVQRCNYQKFYDDESFTVKKIKKQRNKNSNTLRYFMKYLKGFSKNTEKLKQLIFFHKLSITAQQFLELISLNVKTAKHYVKPGIFQNIINGKGCSEEFSLIFRILLRKFLRSQSSIFIQKCSKLSKKAKIKQIYDSKIIYNKLFKKSGRKIKKQ